MKQQIKRQDNQSLIEELLDPSNKAELQTEIILGIDEAGRGPVLGPMVYGICAWPLSLDKKLGSLGFQDSKLLDKQSRSDYFKTIKQLDGISLRWCVDVIPAEQISNQMLAARKVSLNEISFQSAFKLIYKALREWGLNVVHVFVDTVGPVAAYEDKLNREFGQEFPGIKFTPAEKADSKFKIVSAASICAKVTRDEVIEKWVCKEKVEVGTEYGSGYPGDEVTKKWLRENFDRVMGFTDIVRISWKTAENLIEEMGVRVDFHERENQEQESLEKMWRVGRKKEFRVFQNLLEIGDQFKL